jgi:glycogen synthase
MRILFVSQEYPPETAWGGIGTYLYTICHALAQRGHEVHVLSAVVKQRESHCTQDGIYIHRVGQVELKPLWRLGFGSTLYRLQTALSNYRAFRRLGLHFDIIETPDVRAEGLFFLLLRGGPPVVTHFHRNDFSSPSSLDARIARSLEDLCIVKADHVTFATSDSSRYIGHPLDRTRATVIPHPIRWCSMRDTRAGEAPPRALFVGRFEPIKNPKIIVEAVPLVLKHVPEAKFTFVGYEPSWARGYLASLRTLVEAEGVQHAVEFREWLTADKLSDLRSVSRVCVVPSITESFGLVAAESMVEGRPVVASRAPGLREIVQDGQTGRLVDPEDHFAWAAAITEFLVHPDRATEVGERARTEARQRYDPEVAALRREEVYAKVVAHRKPRGAR